MGRLSALTTIGLVIAGAVVFADDRAGQLQILAKAEARLKAIYDKREFVPATFTGKWLRDSSGYLNLEKSRDSSEPELVQYDAMSGKRSVVIGKEHLVVPGTAERLIIQEYVQSPVSTRFLVHVQNSTTGKNGYSLFDSTSGTLKPIVAEIGRLSWENAFSPQGDRLIFGRGPNLYVCDLTTNKSTALTAIEGKDILENDIRAIWSPDGQQIAYAQSDSSKVRQRPVIQPTDPTYPEVSFHRFARVGTPIPTLRVGVVQANGGETRWMNLPADPGTFYINGVSWAGNSEELLVEMLSRSRDARQFLLINVKSGAINKAYEETDPAWVDASYAANAGLEWIHDGKAFVLLSERDGWRHAYVVSRDGKQRKLLTKQASDIIARGPVDERNDHLYFFASPENATQRYLYRVNLDGDSEPQRVTPAGQPGTHRYEFSPDRKWAFHTYSTFDSPPVIDLVQLPEHRSVRVIEDNKECRQRVAPLITQPTEFLKLDIGDGVVMDAWMIKPHDFDATKQYPVFVFIYGEPHGQTVLDDWTGGQNHSMFHRMIADFGYLVVSIDGRGTPSPKGAIWRRAVFGSLGPLSTEEQAAGVKELGRMRSYVDLSRVGIWGWSGGGSNTLNAMFRKPDVYHVGIAVAPKPQPDLYNAWFQEIFMRTREENPEGYQKSAPINFAEGLRGDLLIIHGTGETNTHLQITEGLVDRLIELGKRFDYMAYPNRDHGLREGKGTAVHLRLLITRYLIEHLPPGPR
ncbi:MAG: DPP IV N-terminal domain-containing protein [Planctomycetota bacterium]